MLRWVEGEDKFKAGKSKVIVLNGEERLECEVHVDGISLEHVSEFKYLGYIWTNHEGLRCHQVPG